MRFGGIPFGFGGGGFEDFFGGGGMGRPQRPTGWYFVIFVTKSCDDMYQSVGILCIQAPKPLSAMKRLVWKKLQQQRKFENPIS